MRIDPLSLPVYKHRDAIVAAVRDHPVTVVLGPAGSGKTTQLPSILCEAGLVPHRIGVTQPRRIAAVSVAWRIAAERQCALGDEVGYAIRFDDATSAATRIKVMTDGILLQEARNDPLLRAYDVVMIDEAHERSLNIDFALGLLYRVLRRRPDLRVVVSSATLHPGHFQTFFAGIGQQVPVVTVDSRTYPLTVAYAPLRHGGPDRIVEAVADHVEAIHRGPKPGHVLVFLPGEGLITRTEQLLAQRRLGHGLWVLPLYGRLTREEQERVFEEAPGRRKVILSTNVAETSVTIDDVHFVIDCGLCKLPWFNPQTGVTTLREEPVSQASATQRAGRAGRVGPGHVIRLYAEASLQARPPFTPEEILRVDLSEAVLRLIDLGVADVEHFEFPTRPPPGKLAAALEALTAMGAIDTGRQLTAIGRQMVPFPLAPAMARMVVEAQNRFPEAACDVLLVGAYLSVRSPFGFPPGQEEAARRAHRRLFDPMGDAITGVKLFRAWRLCAPALRADFCAKRFVDNDTLAFIERAHSQLCDIASQQGVEVVDTQADPEHVVRCVATGYADRVLVLRGALYFTLTGLKASVHPSSSLYGRLPRFAVAAELMSSGRTYAFNVSALRPEWLAEVSPAAARAWLKRPPRAAAAPAPAPAPARGGAPTPTLQVLTLGDVTLEVQARRRRPFVEIPLAVVRRLAQVDPASLPPATRRYRARVFAPGAMLMRCDLDAVLRLAEGVPWPTEAAPAALLRVPLGALLELDRNGHAIGRYLPSLMAPMGGSEVPRVGWLTLVGNGGQGFWFDIVSDYFEALESCLAALAAIDAGGAAAEPLRAATAAAQAHVQGLADAVSRVFR